MSRAVIAVVAFGVIVGAACSGGAGGANRIAAAPACGLLAELARTGQTVARADVSDPAAFDATLRAGVTKYIRTARGLRAVVPATLRGDVDRMIAAAEQYRFQDAATARSNIDAYARSRCGTRTSASAG